MKHIRKAMAALLCLALFLSACGLPQPMQAESAPGTPPAAAPAEEPLSLIHI